MFHVFTVFTIIDSFCCVCIDYTARLQLLVHLLETEKLLELAKSLLGVEWWIPFDQSAVELTSRGHRNVSPDDSQDGSSQGHPDDTDRSRHTGGRFTKVELGQEETKGGTLH